MTRPDTDPDFEPRVADWLEADPDSAPAAVLGIVLAALPSIPQRRALRVPWRFPTMNSFAKVAIAAVAVVAVGTVGVIALRPGGTGNVGSAPTPTPTPAPTPTLAPTPTPAPSPTAPPLTGSFTSSIHGISLSYPAGWSTRSATEPWTTVGKPYFTDPSLDVLYDPAPDANLFVGVASQPLAGKTGDQWTADFLGDCPPTEPVTIDGAAGHMSDLPCIIATVTSGGRGYFVWLYTPDSNEGFVFAPYDRAWFEQLLATVDLRPEDAVDAAP